MGVLRMRQSTSAGPSCTRVASEGASQLGSVAARRDDREHARKREDDVAMRITSDVHLLGLFMARQVVAERANLLEERHAGLEGTGKASRVARDQRREAVVEPDRHGDEQLWALFGEEVCLRNDVCVLSGERSKMADHLGAVLRISSSDDTSWPSRRRRRRRELTPHMRVRRSESRGERRAQHHLHLTVRVRGALLLEVDRHSVRRRNDRQASKEPEHRLSGDKVAVSRMTVLKRCRTERGRANDGLKARWRVLIRRPLADVQHEKKFVSFPQEFPGAHERVPLAVLRPCGEDARDVVGLQRDRVRVDLKEHVHVHHEVVLAL